MEPNDATAPTAQEITKRLMNECGLSAQQIAEEMDNRVSWRTIYRWAKGEHEPQQPAAMKALEAVAARYAAAQSPVI